MRSKGSLRIAKLAMVGVLAVLALALLGGGASAARTGNHVILTDPVGDNERQSTNVYASDIQQIELTSQDNGAIRIAITLSDGDAKLVDGDELEVLIDYDRNHNTGSSGFDIDLVATGHSGSATTFALCRLGATRSCEEGPADWAHDTKTATSTHVVDFNVSAGVAAFDFGIVESYTSGSTTLHDIAPNSGLFTFETKADPDNDGVFGTSDRCPTVAARGKFDPNKNGCPGPFAVIGTNDVHFTGRATPSFLTLQRAWVTGVPSGATVVFHMGRTRTVHPRGSTAAIVPGNLRYGSSFTIQITKPAFVGVFLRGKVTRHGLSVTGRSCMKPTGGGPVACSSKLRGS